MDKEIRLGRFDKWGYKNSFSKGELARELTYMNRDYDKQVDNWNKLKKFIESKRYYWGDEEQDNEDYDLEIEDVLNKMQELESSDSDENNK